MTITRTINGNEMTFELTPPEMREAFFEWQHMYDMEDIEWCIDDMDDAECVEQYGVTLEQFRGLISKMAYRMRKYLDNDDGWSDLRDYAIRKIIDEELGDKTVI